MKLWEVEQTSQYDGKGTYAGVHFDESTKDALMQYIKDNNIPNPTKRDKMHTTVLYSRKFCPDYVPLGDIDPPWIGVVDGLEVWPTQSGNNALVITYTSSDLADRHERLMDEHDATYDYDEYKTHVTLSYDIGDMDISTLPDIKQAVPVIKIVEEYGEDLDLDWSSKNSS